MILNTPYFSLFNEDMRSFKFDYPIALLVTNTPVPGATPTKEIEEGLSTFLDKNNICKAFVCCEPLDINVHWMKCEMFSPWRRGEYNEASCRMIIEASTKPGDIVIDPYCGISTTGEAALALGRNYIGIDIDEHCIKESQRRLKNVLEGKPTLDERYVPS